MKELLKNEFYVNSSKNEFIKKYSPWEGKHAREIYNQFLNKEAEFTWLNIDENLKNYLKKEGIKIPSNINYGVPNHVQGDFEKSTLFVCLTNPNIEFKDDEEFYSLDTYYDNDVAKNSSDFSLNNYFKESKSLKKYITSYSKKDSILFKELDYIEQNNFDKDIVKSQYYITNYFEHIVGKMLEHMIVSEKIKFTDIFIKDNNIELKNSLMKKLKRSSRNITNIEAYPFRSKLPGEFLKKIIASDSKVSLFGARIIIWRILKEENSIDKSNKPIFILRRFNDVWKPLITKVLEKDFNCEKDKIVSILRYLHEEYFFTNYKQEHSNMSKYVTENTLYKNNDSISSEEFNEFIRKLIK